MRTDQGDIDIAEYLAKLPDKGKCLTSGEAQVAYIEDRSVVANLDKPYLQGRLGGAVTCSTSVTLVVVPEVIWDANSYYRQLGFSFPYTNITRKQMRLNFFDRDGLDSRRLTYVLKQLLDRDTRRQYDRTPIGELFLDSWVQDFLKDKAIREAQRRHAESGEPVEVDDVLAEWGLKAQSPGDVESEGEAEYGEDADHPSPKDTSDSPESSDPSPKVIPWDWAYYSWRTQRDDTERLARWQQLLVSAFAARKVHYRFAVGFLGKQPHRYVLGDVDGHEVFFLGEDEEPTEELAAVAVVQVLYDKYRHVTGEHYGQLPQGRQAG
jgi:hypothetical protein